MAKCTIKTPHFHGSDSRCRGNAGHIKDAEYFCNAAHPDTVHNCDTGKDEPRAYCRRIGNHDGPHRAFVTEITEPLEWIEL